MLGSTGITHVSYLQNLKEDKRDSRDSTTECGEYKRAWLQAHKKVSEAKAAAMTQKVAAKVLATYLIPGCVGRGVRLGSENSSGAGGAGAGAAGGGAWAQAWAQVGGPTWGPPMQNWRQIPENMFHP